MPEVAVPHVAANPRGSHRDQLSVCFFGDLLAQPLHHSLPRRSSFLWPLMHASQLRLLFTSAVAARVYRRMRRAAQKGMARNSNVNSTILAAGIPAPPWAVAAARAACEDVLCQPCRQRLLVWMNSARRVPTRTVQSSRVDHLGILREWLCWRWWCLLLPCSQPQLRTRRNKRVLQRFRCW